MKTFDCGHESSDVAGYVCEHLWGTSDNDYFRLYTGQGRAYRVSCEACAKSDLPETIPWKSVCAECFQRTEAENGQAGVCGMPEVLEQFSSLAFSHRIIRGEFSSDPLRLIIPVVGASGSVWMTLTTGGILVEITFDEITAAQAPAMLCRQITTITSDDLPLMEGVSLVCSAGGKLVCLTETLGQTGVVIETGEGQRTLRLHRDDYHCDVTPFPAAFMEWEGRTLLIHGVDWNRLDISDPRGGELLTERSPTSYQRGETEPTHYLDYFHGRLLLSPDGRFIADDGWVWHPIGIVRTWDIHAWLKENLWESEDGSSVRKLPWRGYFWGGPMCWVNATTLAVWGYGDDEECLVPAARIFDVVSGEEQIWFPGPEVAPLTKAEWPKSMNDFGGRLFFDRYLFAVSEKFGVGVWDIDTGARLHQDVGFAPVAYHPHTKEFLTLLPDGSVQLSRLIEDDVR